MFHIRVMIQPTRSDPDRFLVYVQDHWERVGTVMVDGYEQAQSWASGVLKEHFDCNAILPGEWE